MKISWFNEELKRFNANAKHLMTFEVARRSALLLHASVHTDLADFAPVCYETALYKHLLSQNNKLAVNKKGRTAMYGIWHATRIEDIVVNILMSDSRQILTPDRQKLIESPIADTGNQLTPSEILAFTEQLNLSELLAYRRDTALNTRSFLMKMTANQLVSKPSPSQLKRILQEQAVADHPDAIWLIDFWAKKTGAGLIAMPLTRHNLVHINESFSALSVK